MIADIDCPIMTNVQKRICVEAALSSAPAPLAGNYSEWERKHLEVSIIIAACRMLGQGGDRTGHTLTLATGYRDGNNTSDSDVIFLYVVSHRSTSQFFLI